MLMAHGLICVELLAVWILNAEWIHNEEYVEKHEIQMWLINAYFVVLQHGSAEWGKKREAECHKLLTDGAEIK